MKKSSNELTFAIILATVILISAVILFKNLSHNLIGNYDVLGIIDLNLFIGNDLEDDLSTDTKLTDVLNESTDISISQQETDSSYDDSDETEQSTQTENHSSQSTSDTMPNTKQEIIPNNSRENAWAVSFDQKIAGEFEKDGVDWYKFTTGSEIAVYRFEAFPTIENISDSTYIYLRTAIYDSDGLKIDEFNVHCRDEYGFLDIYLTPNTEYFIKVYGTDFGSTSKAGAYELCVSEMVCDVGINKESATKLELDIKQVGIVNSTLSDWYVFEVTKNGEYRFTLHNINVGCDIYISIERPGSAGTGISIANEDNYSGRFKVDMKEGDLVYFEIYSYGKNPTANGKYVLIIEEDDN